MIPPVPLASGMRRVARAYIIDHDTGVESQVGLLSASVEVDAGSDCRRVVSAQLVDVDPRLLTPPHRLRVEAGYVWGGVEYVAPVHVRIGKVARTNQRVWSLSDCRSFEAIVKGDRFVEPRRLEGGASIVETIRALILEAVPWARVEATCTYDASIPRGGIVAAEDRWGTIVGRDESLATAISADVYCDGAGTFRITDVPTIETPGWDATRCTESWSRGLDGSTVVNSWVAHSDNPDVSPVRGIAEDIDPFSPTRISRWGRVTKFHASPLYSSDEQCARGARTLLSKTRGVTRELSIETVPNWWADVTEPVQVETDLGVESHLVDRVTVRVEADPQSDAVAMQLRSRLVGVSA